MVSFSERLKLSIKNLERDPLAPSEKRDILHEAPFYSQESLAEPSLETPISPGIP